MLLTKNEIGSLAEIHATKLLVDKGHIVLARNFKTKFGEIDIITKKNKVLFLHEVKVSKSIHSYPFHNWNLIQKQRMIKAFRYFFKHEQLDNCIEIKISFIWFAITCNNRLKLIMFNNDIEIDQ